MFKWFWPKKFVLAGIFCCNINI